MIWLCVFQHIAIANPLNPFHIRIPQSSQKEEREKYGMIQSWLYSYFVDEGEKEEEEEEKEQLLHSSVK